MTELYPAETYPAEIYEPRTPSFFTKGDSLAQPRRAQSLESIRDLASEVFSPIFQATADQGEELDGIAGKIVGFIYEQTGIDLSILFETVGGWIDDGISTVKRIVDDILGIFNNIVVTPINALVQGVKDWWQNLTGWRTNTDTAIVAISDQATIASEDAAVAAALAAANESANIANSTALAEANLALGTKANLTDIPTNVPGWVSLNPIEDAVFPHADLVPIPVGVSGETGDEIGGEYLHSHTLTAARTSIVWAQPVYTTALGRLDIAYINATRARIYNTVGFSIAAQTIAAGSRANMLVVIYKMGKNAFGLPDGELTQIWTSGVGSAASIPAAFGTAADDIRLDLGADIVATQGDWFAACVFQYGSGKTPRNLLGKRTADKNAVSGVYPTRLGMTMANQTSPPATLSPSQLDNTSSWIPWMFMGQSLGLVKIALADLFDRANAATLGPNWAVYGVGMDIFAGVARCKRIDHGRFTSRKEDFAQAVYVSQLATDAQAASVKIDAFDRTNASLEENPRAQVAVRANSDMSHSVRVGIRWGLIEIRLYNAANPTGTTMRTTSRTWASGDVVELRATDDVGTGKTDFTAYVNDVAVLTWPDLADEASKGPAFRRAAFETASTHRGAIFGYLSIPSVGANEWKARDL